MAIPVAGRDVSDGGSNNGAIAGSTSYHDPIYLGTLEDGAHPRPKDGHRIVRACLCGLFGGITILLAVVSMTSSYLFDDKSGKGDEDDGGNDFVTPSPNDARVVGTDEDLPRYSFEEHGMSRRRLFLDGDGSSSSSPSASSSPSRDVHHHVHDETTDDANGMSFGGPSAMDEQIESRSELPQDYIDDETSSSVHEEPCVRKATMPHSCSEYYIVPASDEDEKHVQSSRSNNDTIALSEGSKIIAENPIVATCDLENFSPRLYSQGPDSPAWCDGIAALPYSNALSTSDETTRWLNDHDQSNISETHFGREEKSRGNILTTTTNKSCDKEHQVFSTYSSKLGRALTGNAEKEHDEYKTVNKGDEKAKVKMLQLTEAEAGARIACRMKCRAL